MNVKYVLLLSAAIALTSGLTGCGGGGSSGPVSSTDSFPLYTAFTSVAKYGYSYSFTIRDSCSGTGNIAVSAANTPSTFEGVNGFSATETLTMNFTDCIPATLAQTLTSYYDNNYLPLGFNSPGVNYGVFQGAPNIPSAVHVGDTGVIGSENLWTDSTKTTPNGRSDFSYVVKPDTANTAIVDEIIKDYDASNVLEATEQHFWRIDTFGNLTPVTWDIQYANGYNSNFHLLLTFL
jgi:hypothetical protein